MVRIYPAGWNLMNRGKSWRKQLNSIQCRLGDCEFSSWSMNTKDVIRLGVPLGDAQRRAVDFIAQFILRGGDKSLAGTP